MGLFVSFAFMILHVEFAAAAAVEVEVEAVGHIKLSIQMDKWLKCEPLSLPPWPLPLLLPHTWPSPMS